MNFNSILKVLLDFSTCDICGSNKIGNGEGTITFEEDYFERTCICGWTVTVFQDELDAYDTEKEATA